MEILLVGGFNHLEKYESQWEGFSNINHIIIMENKMHLPNHQPAEMLLSCSSCRNPCSLARFPVLGLPSNRQYILGFA
jgi:hypothetical protein